jgi:hypothetical protein
MGRVRDGKRRAGISPATVRRSDRRPRSAALPFLAPVIRRRTRTLAKVLADVLAVIEAAPIREAAIHHEGALVFGHCHDDRSISINIDLARTVIALHELLHRAYPAWSERTVRAQTTRLLNALSDDQLAAINRRILATIAAR